MLSVVDFGRELVTSGDLDPVYVALHRAGAELPPEKLKRFLLAYWCFYNCGTASWIVDRPKMHYWSAMLGAAESPKYPRGTERRHFRGELAVSSVRALMEWDVGQLFELLCSEPHPVPLSAVMTRVMKLRGFGEWIAFKVADMLERLGLCPVAFGEADAFLFDSPREGAQLVVDHYANGEHVPAAEAPAWAFGYLAKHLGHLPAPPSDDRLLNGQEYETILCKWKAHLNGYYEPGKDIHELREALLKFAKQPTAQLLLRSL